MPGTLPKRTRPDVCTPLLPPALLRRRLGVRQLGIDAFIKRLGVRLAVVVCADLAAHMPQLTRKHSAAKQQALETACIVFVQVNSGIGMQVRRTKL